MKYIICIGLMLIQGCSVSMGIGLHAEKNDKPEFNGDNPMGIIEGTMPLTEKIEGFCFHVSSFPNHEIGDGLNMCGVKLRISE